jgi:GMP synthase (glutamine-hydrolysing)
VQAKKGDNHVNRLFEGLEGNLDVYMSHGDKLSNVPKGFHTIAETSNSPFAGIAHETKPIYGIQFHPEVRLISEMSTDMLKMIQVTHTPRGIKLLENFAVGICGAKQNWTMAK